MAKDISLTLNTTNLSCERLMIGIRTKIVSRKVSRIVEFLSFNFIEISNIMQQGNIKFDLIIDSFYINVHVTKQTEKS